MRARHLGVPPPPLFSWPFHSHDSDPFTPAPSGIRGVISSTLRKLRNPRSTRGAYEETSYGGSGGRRGRGNSSNALDPDGAWDARVGSEADGVGGGGGYHYDEEQELGVADPTHYGGRGYGAPATGGTTAGLSVETGAAAGRGRSRDRERELDQRYEEEVHGKKPAAAAAAAADPFGDAAERSDMSLRGMSPRPMADEGRRRAGDVDDDDARSQGSLQSSPIERRSAFREGV